MAANFVNGKKKFGFNNASAGDYTMGYLQDVMRAPSRSYFNNKHTLAKDEIDLNDVSRRMNETMDDFVQLYPKGVNQFRELETQHVPNFSGNTKDPFPVEAIYYQFSSPKDMLPDSRKAIAGGATPIFAPKFLLKFDMEHPKWQSQIQSKNKIQDIQAGQTFKKETEFNVNSDAFTHQSRKVNVSSSLNNDTGMKKRPPDYQHAGFGVVVERLGRVVQFRQELRRQRVDLFRTIEREAKDFVLDLFVDDALIVRHGVCCSVAFRSRLQTIALRGCF